MGAFATGTDGAPSRRRPTGEPAAPDVPATDGPPAPPAPGCAFVEQWGASTWRGRAEDGRPVVCQRVTLPPAARDVDRRFLRQRVAELLATREPELVPVRRILPQGPSLWMLSDVDDGVSLLRLLDRAKPSLAEAAVLAALVLDAVAAMHAGGHTHGELDSRAVRVGLDGAVRIAGWGPNALFPASPDDEVRRADIRAAAGIVAEIAKSAGRPTRPLTRQEDRLVARLSSNADPRSLARRGPLKAARGLETAVGPSERRRSVHQRVVGLARAVATVDAPAVAGPAATDDRPLPGGALIANGSPGRALPPPARRPPIWPRVWKGAAIGALVAVVLGVELRRAPPAGACPRSRPADRRAGDPSRAPAPGGLPGRVGLHRRGPGDRDAAGPAARRRLRPRGRRPVPLDAPTPPRRGAVGPAAGRPGRPDGGAARARRTGVGGRSADEFARDRGRDADAPPARRRALLRSALARH
ncbi:MAG: hypothetical protein E6G66_19105 [Actinobacteria bacterium]|nr:MAG: hypothetical protein E6G66_19105 [Actinomycetota bacterium]